MEAGTGAFLESAIASLQSAGRTVAVDVLTRAREACMRSQWCEMTDDLLLAIRDPMVLEFGYELHENVLKCTRRDMSPMAYVKLLHYICFGPNSTLERALDLIHDATSFLNTSPLPQGKHAARCIQALLLLDNHNDDGTQIVVEAAQQARCILDEVEGFIHSKQMHEVEPVLAALHCRARGKDYEIRRKYTQFYTNAFETVKSAERAEMPIIESDMLTLSYTTAIAALLSEEIYNFGKLLNDRHFTGRLLASAEHAWILEWLSLCNDGKVDAFEQYANTHKARIAANATLSSALPAIMGKVRVMALLHLVFYTPFNERTFTFDVIARRCAVDAEAVEPLLLAALAQGVVVGKIDGLAGEVHITWVEPRVLSPLEVKGLAAHVAQWREKAAGLLDVMRATALETST